MARLHLTECLWQPWGGKYCYPWWGGTEGQRDKGELCGDWLPKTGTAFAVWQVGNVSRWEMFPSGNMLMGRWAYNPDWQSFEADHSTNAKLVSHLVSHNTPHYGSFHMVSQNTPHYQNEGEKWYDLFKGCSESVWYNSKLILNHSHSNLGRGRNFPIW